jgi:FMN phosphatase YigB (HAD superfamily)
VHVGDSVLSDVEGAHAAGLVAVWLDRHGDAWPPPPGVHRITSLTELPDLLTEIETA